jgi:hypothetical protein
MKFVKGMIIFMLISLTLSTHLMSFSSLLRNKVERKKKAPITTKNTNSNTNQNYSGSDCSAGNELAGSAYLIQGYNVVEGDPETTGDKGIDPGFKLQAIFAGNAAKSNDYCVSNMAYSTFVQVNTMNTCSNNESTTFHKTVSEWKASYATEMGVGAELPGVGGFSASKSFSMAYSTSTTKETSFAEQQIKCVSYKANYSISSKLTFSSAFQNMVSNLNSNYANGKTAYLRLMDTFGTHAFKELTLGSKFGRLSWIDSSLSTKEFNASYKSELKANVSAEGAKVDANTSSTSTVSTLNSDENKSSKLSEYLFGKISKNDVGFTSSFSDAVPINYKLESLSNLFDSSLWPQIDMTFLKSNKNGLTTSILQTNLATALKDYCAYYKTSTGKTFNCNGEVDPVFYVTDITFISLGKASDNPCPYGYKDWTSFNGGNDFKKRRDLNSDAGGNYIYGCQKIENTATTGNTLLKQHLDSYVIARSRDEKTNYTKQGYTCNDTDLNESAGGNYMYFCYKMTTANRGIKNLGVLYGESDTCTKNNGKGFSFATDANNRDCRQYICTCVDLNENAGGDYLYACHTTNLSPGQSDSCFTTIKKKKKLVKK